MVQTGTSVITIAVQGGQATYSIIGRPQPQEIFQAMDAVRDDIMVAVAKQEAQQEVGSGQEESNFKEPGPDVLPQGGIEP